MCSKVNTREFSLLNDVSWGDWHKHTSCMKHANLCIKDLALTVCPFVEWAWIIKWPQQILLQRKLGESNEKRLQKLRWLSIACAGRLGAFWTRTSADPLDSWCRQFRKFQLRRVCQRGEGFIEEDAYGWKLSWTDRRDGGACLCWVSRSQMYLFRLKDQ